MCAKSTSLPKFIRSSHAYIMNSHVRSYRNVKECAETAQFKLCKRGVNKGGHVPHVYVLVNMNYKVNI